MAAPKEIRVSFEVLSGEQLGGCAVSRSATAWELHTLASLELKSGMCFRLALGTKVIETEYEQPLLNLPDAQQEAVLTCIAVRGDDLQTASASFGLLSFVRSSRFGVALRALRTHKEPRRLIESSPMLLNWACYCCAGAGGRHRAWYPEVSPTALDLIWEILLLAPQLARSVGDCGFLPLHDAAWGNAPNEVALMLLAVYPSALHVRCQGDSARDVGRMEHSTRFTWLENDQLLSDAAALRCRGRQLATLCRLRKLHSAKRLVRLEDAAALSLRLPPIAGLAVSSFLVGPEKKGFNLFVRSLSSDPETNTSDSVVESAARISPVIFRDSYKNDTYPAAHETCKSHQPRREFVRIPARPRIGFFTRRQRPSRGRLPRPEPEATGQVEHLQEASSRDAGRFAGAREVRHHRCGFVEISKIAVDAQSFIIRAYRVRTVNSEVQRSSTIPRWPSKATWRRERALERLRKISGDEE